MSYKLTNEQQAVVDKLGFVCENEKQFVLTVLAYAGTGKTSTILQALDIFNRPDLSNLRVLVAMFNKGPQISVSRMFKKKYPYLTNVDVKTTLSVVFKLEGFKFFDKLCDERNFKRARKLELKQISIVCELQPAFFNEPEGGVFSLSQKQQAQFILNTVLAYQKSKFYDFKDFLSFYLENFHLRSKEVSNFLIKVIRIFSPYLWGRMSDPRDVVVPCTSETYLKTFYNRKPNLRELFDLIILDEAQDTNKLISSILKSFVEAGGILVAVGDQFQSIYAFAGATDALAFFQNKLSVDSQLLRLTQSFRFGAAIANVANNFLGTMLPFFEQCLEAFVVGNPQQNTIIVPNFDNDHELVTTISRSNIGLVEAVLCELDKIGSRPYVFIDMAGLILELESAFYLFKKEFFKVIHSNWLVFTSWNDAFEVAKNNNDADALRIIKLVEKWDDSTPDMIFKLKSIRFTKKNEATSWFVTAHKAKGLQFPNVLLWDDFKALFDEDQFGCFSLQCGDVQEVYLLYVALTRAEDKLCLCDALKNVLNLEPERLFEAIFWFKFWNETTVSGEELKNLIDEKKAELSLVSFEEMKKGNQIFLSPTVREDMPMVANEVKDFKVTLPVLPALPTVVEAVKSIKQPIIFFKSEQMCLFGVILSLNMLKKKTHGGMYAEVLRKGIYLVVSANLSLKDDMGRNIPFIEVEGANFYFFSTKKDEAKRRIQELEGPLQEAILKYIGIEFSKHLGDMFLVDGAFMDFSEIIRDFSQPDFNKRLPTVSKQNISNSILLLKEEFETTINQFELFLNENK